MEAFENYVPGHVEIMVDAIFGVGLSREVGGEFAEAIRFMREQEPKAVVAVDIPSGVSFETGAALARQLRRIRPLLSAMKSWEWCSIRDGSCAARL